MLESTASGDPFHLSRFEIAQASVIEAVRAELRAGRKVGHWMWFVFPQLRGLGSSAMACRYALSGLGEARAYLAHPVLGARLRECASLLLGVGGRSAAEIVGATDALKLRSCMTLFAQATAQNEVFLAVLARYFDARFDPATLQGL